MKRIVVVSFVLCSLFFSYYLHRSSQISKVSEFKSVQKGIVSTDADRIVDTGNKNVISKYKSGIVKAGIVKNNLATTPARNVAEKATRGNKVEQFLSQSRDGYNFSEDVVVVNRKDFIGKAEDVLSIFQEMLVVGKEHSVNKWLYLVRKEDEKRVGVYMGKIVISHQQDQMFEDRLKSATNSSEKVSYLSGVYFLESRDIGQSIELLSRLKKEFPEANVELDIKYERNLAK